MDDERRDQIRLEDLVIGHRGHALLQKKISLTIKKGEFWGIVGPNGAGKTTLIKTLLGIIPPVKGKIDRTEDLSFGYVPQQGILDDIFPLTVFDVVLMGRYAHIGPMRWVKRSDRELARRDLDRVGIVHLADRPFRSLSGRQKQRTLLARGLAAEPDILILDEPTEGMDLGGENGVMNLILDLKAESGLTILMITHVLNLMANFAEQLIIIHQEENLFETGVTAELLNARRLREIYRLDVEVQSFHDQKFIFVDRSPLKPQPGKG
ncbi:MAG: metal ABC transporter ATP-binding protein [Nitrospira sp.]|nr:metal ABC transporter ATP-binding protein [Candidatus Manganitrophaceae bacterium]HIL33927.1 metal ABC transporter ATP-binding protein [Candidatus Manganitrophaceae bacterium]